MSDPAPIDWEYRCIECGHEETVADDTIDFYPPTALVVAICEEPDCGGRMRHVGPVLDECDRCFTPLLYHGNSGLGDDTLCDGCYDDLDAMM